MKKFTGNYDILVETAIQRFQQGGFLTGDVVKIKKNALNHEKLKEASEPVKQRIKELQETNSNLRVSAVKTIRSNTSTGEIGGVTAPSCYYADVVQELNPGLWVNPMTLPIEVLEKIDLENFYPDVPESLRRLNKKSDTGSDEMGAVADTRKAEDLNLPTKNTKLANAESWDDSKPGAGATKDLEKIKEEKVSDEQSLSNLYEGIWDKASNAVGAVLNNVDAHYDFGRSKDERSVSGSGGQQPGYGMRTMPGMSVDRQGSGNSNVKVKTKGSGLSGTVNLGGAARDVYSSVTKPSQEEQELTDFEREKTRMQRQAELNRIGKELGVNSTQAGQSAPTSGARTPTRVYPGKTMPTLGD